MGNQKDKISDDILDDDELLEGYDESIDFNDTTDDGKESGKSKKRGVEPMVIVDAKVLLSEIQSYYSTNRFSQKLADMILRLAENMARRNNFSGYSWKDEMILDGYEKMAMAIYNKKFDITQNYSPFSYLSRICWRSFVLRIKKEKQIKEHEKNYREMMYEKIKSENTGLYYTKQDSNGETILLTHTTNEDNDWD